MNPLTRWMLDPTGSPCDSLFFIFRRIETLLESQDLLWTLQRLAILAIRFERYYILEAQADWPKHLPNKFDFFEDLHKSSPEKLVKEMTKADIKLFMKLNIEDLHESNETGVGARRGRRCQRLYDRTIECAIISFQLREVLSDIAIVNSLRPLHSRQPRLT